MARWRRVYRPGTCQDCGHLRSITVIKFWVNGMLYRVCAQCIAPYRGVICTQHGEL